MLWSLIGMSLRRQEGYPALRHGRTLPVPEKRGAEQSDSLFLSWVRNMKTVPLDGLRVRLAWQVIVELGVLGG
jgi:hypothetical protein